MSRSPADAFDRQVSLAEQIRSKEQSKNRLADTAQAAKDLLTARNAERDEAQATYEALRTQRRPHGDKATSLAKATLKRKTEQASYQQGATEAIYRGYGRVKQELQALYRQEEKLIGRNAAAAAQQERGRESQQRSRDVPGGSYGVETDTIYVERGRKRDSSRSRLRKNLGAPAPSIVYEIRQPSTQGYHIQTVEPSPERTGFLGYPTYAQSRSRPLVQEVTPMSSGYGRYQRR